MKNVISMFVAFVAVSVFAQLDGTPTGSLKKAIVPLVGSTAGANGAQWKTSLSIQALPGAHGRIVFHPFNTVARADDPSIPYSFPETATNVDFAQFDDIVAAMGQSGLGTLDIIPDANGGNIVPAIRARIFNQTANGTFGTEEGPVYPLTYFVNLYGQPPANGIAVLHETTFVPPMSSQFRRNIGFRTLTNVTFSGYIARKDGSRLNGVIGTFDGEYTTMMSVEEFARQYFFTTIGPDDGLGIFAQGNGQAIVFYTYTDNGTNDPTLIVSPPVEQNIMLAQVP